VADWGLKMKMVAAWPVGEGCGWLAFKDEDGGRKMWLAGV